MSSAAENYQQFLALWAKARTALKVQHEQLMDDIEQNGFDPDFAACRVVDVRGAFDEVLSALEKMEPVYV